MAAAVYHRGSTYVRVCKYGFVSLSNLSPILSTATTLYSPVIVLLSCEVSLGTFYWSSEMKVMEICCVKHVGRVPLTNGATNPPPHHSTSLKLWSTNVPSITQQKGLSSRYQLLAVRNLSNLGKIVGVYVGSHPYLVPEPGEKPPLHNPTAHTVCAYMW